MKPIHLVPMGCLLAGCASPSAALPPAPPSAALPPASPSAALPPAPQTPSVSDPSNPAASTGSLEWRGGPTAILERNGFRLLTDPMLGPRSKNAAVLPKHPSTGVANAPVTRHTDPPSRALGRLDLIILSHNHTDHFDKSAKDTLPKDVLFALPPSAAEVVRSHGFTNVRPLDWNEETSVSAGATRLRITAVPARHSHDPVVDASLGKGNGYVLTWEAPTRYVVYWTGDAVFSPDMRAIAGRFAGADLWLPHLGAVGVDGAHGLRTLDADEAVAAMAVLQPRQVIPIHHTTFSHYREPVEAFVQRAATTGMGARVTLPVHGEPVALAN